MRNQRNRGRALVVAVACLGLVGVTVPAAAAQQGTRSPVVAQQSNLDLPALLAQVDEIAEQTASENQPGDGPSTMIVGGQDATELNGEVSIQDANRHRCGGDLITKQWVLSAAHCSVILVPGAKIRTGSLSWTTGGQLVGFNLAEVQPNYTGEVWANDFVLIRLDQRVNAKPISVGLNAGKIGTRTRISGWGKICDTDQPECSTLPDRLQQLDTKLVAPTRCTPPGATTEDGTPWFNPTSEVCVASRDDEPRMACNGDSGGPLRRWTRSGQQVLIGVTSGDGDDTGPRVNDCITGYDGSAGVGVWGRTGPQVEWIVTTLWQHDRAAAIEFVKNLRP